MKIKLLKTVNVSSTSRGGLSRAAALAVRALVEVTGGVLGGDDANLEHQIVAGGAYPSNGPPTEEGLDPDAIEVGYSAVRQLAGDPAGIGGEVVVRGEGDAATVVEVDGEGAGGAVEGVGEDVGGEEADGEPAGPELVVSGTRFKVRILGEGEEGEGEEGDEDDENSFRHAVVAFPIWSTAGPMETILFDGLPPRPSWSLGSNIAGVKNDSRSVLFALPLNPSYRWQIT